MIKFKIEDKEYEMPENWSEVTIPQFKDITYLEEDLPLYRGYKDIINILSPKITEEMMNQMDILDFQKIISLVEFTRIAPDKELRVIEIEGKEYGIIENLDKISVGEWADLETYISRGGDDIIGELENILSIIVRPLVSKDNGSYKIEKYDSYSMNERVDLFKRELNAEDAMAFMGFFLRLEAEFIQNTLNSSMETMMEMGITTLENIGKVGDGSDSSTN